MTDFINFLHIDESVKTLDEFIERNFINNLTSVELLNYSNNSIKILENYLPEDGTVAIVSILRTPTMLKVPVVNVQREFLITQNNVVESNDFIAFWDEKIKQIIQDDGYIQKTDESSFSGSTFFKKEEGFSVFVFSSFLKKMINLTSFISDLKIEKSKENGTFSFDLIHLEASYEDNKWNTHDISSEDGSDVLYDLSSSLNYTSKSKINFFDGEKVKRTNSLFHLLLHNNDLVFIRFEKLSLKEQQTNFSDQVFDMIGLIDENKASLSNGLNSIKIVITGRDLTKVLIEDGVYFFPLDFADNDKDYFQNNDDSFVRGDFVQTPIKRLITGELSFFNSYVDRTIDFSLRFIFNALTNVNFVSDSLSQFYKNNELTYRNGFIDKNGFDKKEASGIWKIISLVVDKEIANRRLVDSSISTQKGNILSFVKKVAQEPFVEFWGDTYGAKFYFICRKPPFNGYSFKNNFTLDIDEGQVLGDTLFFDDSEVFSWYRLTPKGNYFGNDVASLLEFPAIYLSRYMEKWGNRPYEVVTNYIDYNGWLGQAAGDNLNYVRDQSLQDLKFIIESNCYKPFSRKGTITIKGERRIKVGMNIRYKPTGEIFHVVGVSNNLNITRDVVQRVTRLTVERGMIEKYIRPDLNQAGEISYFNIVRFIEGSDKRIRVKVDDDVFDFFLQNKAWI